jgi:putative PIN family toxin of toxin-antitoxin system
MDAKRPKVRAVFDCMVFLQAAARRESPAAACLLLVELGAVELCLSEAIMNEIQEVLARVLVRQRFPVLTNELVGEFLNAIEKRSVVVQGVPLVFPYERDPKDEPYINLAIATAANYLVSRDTDLLDLTEQDNADGVRLRSCAPQLQIVDPGTFLADVRRTL